MKRANVFFAMLLTIAMSAFAQSAMAASKTFSGPGNFSNAALWGGTLPVAGDNLRINGSCVYDVTTNLAYGYLRVGRTTAGTLTWPAGSTSVLQATYVYSSVAGSAINMSNGGVLQINTTAALGKTPWVTTNQTFTPGAGKVVWNVNYAQNLPATIPTYRDLTISSTGAVVTGLGVATTVTGNLLISSGVLNAAAFALNVAGNFTNNSTYTAGTGTVTLNGTTAQTVTGTITFNKLTLSNAAGVIISGNTTVNSTFTPGTTPITVNAGSTLKIGATTYTGPCSGVYGVGYCSAATVVSINTATANPTTAGVAVAWTVVFSKSVTGVAAANFALVQAGGVTGATITSVTGAGTTWTVNANTGAGTGTLGLNMVNVTAISPAVTTAMPFVDAGSVYTVTLTCFTDNFNRANGPPAGNWIVANEGGAFGNPTIFGNRLRLTDATASVSTMAALQQLFPAAGNKITVEFDHFAYGGSGADGMGVVLSDASVAPVPGAFGGSLGYAPKQVAQGGDTTHPGFAGGWIGLALDEYGNFSANTEGRSGGAAPGLTLDSAAVRGSGSGYTGYPYHRGTATLAPGVDLAGATPAPGYRYRITIDHSNGVNAWTSVERDTGTGYVPLISPYDAKAEPGQAAVPTNWFLSFTGSTGASTNIHEVDNLKVCSTQPQSLPTLDHVRIAHDGAGLTCGAETVTLKACADASCSTLYLGSVTVDLSPTGGTTATGQWSADPVTFTGGSKQITLTRTTAGSVTMSGLVTSPAATNSTAVCYNGSSELACAGYPLPFTLSSACFNAAERYGAPGDPIYTKLSGTSFSLDIMAASGTTVITSFLGAVNVALVDPAAASGNCTDTATGLTAESAYTFVANDAGRKTFNFNYPNAAKNIKVRITSAGQSTCSSDDFSIRPFALSVQSNPSSASADLVNGNTAAATPRFKAGTDTFTVSPIAVLSTGVAVPRYTGLPKVDAALLQGTTTLGTLVTSPTPTTPPTFQTAAASNCTTCAPTGTFSYNEVGYLRFDYLSLYDDTWSGNDITNSHCTNDFSNTPVNGKYGCKFGNTSAIDTATLNRFWAGRFIPDHFDTVAAGPMACAAGAGCAVPVTTMAYSGQPFSVQVTAKNAGGNTTQNYQGGFAKAVTLSAVASNGGAAIPIVAPGGALTANIAAAVNFASGSNSATPANPVFTFATALTAPTDVYVRAADTDGVTSLRAVSSEGGVRVVSGRVKVANAYGSELLPLTLTATVQYYNATGSWVTSSTDTVTAIIASNFALAFPVAAANNLAACETALTVTGSSPNFNVNLSEPGNGNNGWTNLTLNLGAAAAGNQCTAVGGSGPASTTANRPWLQFPAGSNPTARATFGVYQGRREFIYLRENY